MHVASSIRWFKRLRWDKYIIKTADWSLNCCQYFIWLDQKLSQDPQYSSYYLCAICLVNFVYLTLKSIYSSFNFNFTTRAIWLAFSKFKNGLWISTRFPNHHYLLDLERVLTFFTISTFILPLSLGSLEANISITELEEVLFILGQDISK